MRRRFLLPSLDHARRSRHSAVVVSIKQHEYKITSAGISREGMELSNDGDDTKGWND